MPDVTTDTKATDSEAKSANISSTEASEILQRAVGDLRQSWIQGAVRVASIVSAGQTVGRGTFDDLRTLRENWEELERARSFLRGPRAVSNGTKANTKGAKKEVETVS